MSRALLRLAALALLLGMALLPARALASTGYPAEIQTQLQLSYSPPCSYCHANNDTDAGTVTTPFGLKMVAFGLAGENNIPSLDGALAGLVATNDPYIADLRDGIDPNNPTSSSVPPITYGCFNVTGQSRTTGPAAVFVLALALLFLLRPRKA
jgi:hypothetical protein